MAKDKKLTDYVGDMVLKHAPNEIKFDLNIYYKNGDIYVTERNTGNKMQFILYWQNLEVKDNELKEYIIKKAYNPFGGKAK